MTITALEQELNEIPFNTNASIGPSTIEKFIITNAENTKRLEVTGAITEFFFYESILSNTISATVVLIDTGYQSNEKSAGGDKKDDSSLNALRTRGIIDYLQLAGGERVDFKIKHSNLRVQGNGSVLEIPDGMYINRIREINNNSLKDMFALDLVPKEYISNEKSRVVKRYDGLISDSVSDILGDSSILATQLPVTTNKTANSYNFIGNDRKPFYICTWLASKSVPQATDANGKPIQGGGAGYLFYQTRDSFQFRSIDRLLSPTPRDTTTKEPLKKFIYNNTGKRPGDDEAFNILNYTFTRTIDVAKELNLGTFNNRSIFFDPFSMSYKVTLFNTDDQILNYLGRERNIPRVENVINSPTRLMSHVLDTGVMPSGVDSKQQLKKWKEDIVKTNYEAEDIMVQSIMRYNQLFSVQLNITIPGDFSIFAGDRIVCRFVDLTQSDDTNNSISSIYMVSSVCHKVNSQDTFTSLDLVADTRGTVALKLAGDSFLN